MYENLFLSVTICPTESSLKSSIYTQNLLKYSIEDNSRSTVYTLNFQVMPSNDLLVVMAKLWNRWPVLFKYQVWIELAIDIINSWHDSNGLQCYCECCKALRQPDRRYSVRLITAIFSHKCYKNKKCVLLAIIREKSVRTGQPILAQFLALSLLLFSWLNQYVIRN